ncbi:MAG: thymidylate synthase [Cyclobacteriaceae bacterium]|nr:thymidylate synthase [Cyclobacteriaceae bacterium]
MHADLVYHKLLTSILNNGSVREDRTGVGTISVFGAQMEFDLKGDGYESATFPLLPTKKMLWKGIVVELIWFLHGRTDLKFLLDHGVRIWTANANDAYRKKTGVSLSDAEFESKVLRDPEFSKKHGDLGPVYGKQWRAFPTLKGEIDQIGTVLKSLRENPDSRRHIVSAWNPGDIEDMALPPCHCLFQFNSRPSISGRTLDCHLYQRSADVFLGVPFNIASYALLTVVVARLTGHTPGKLVHSIGDAHIYLNHTEAVSLQITRPAYPSPKVSLVGFDGDPMFPEEIGVDSVKLEGYRSHGAIKAPMAV